LPKSQAGFDEFASRSNSTAPSAVSDANSLLPLTITDSGRLKPVKIRVASFSTASDDDDDDDDDDEANTSDAAHKAILASERAREKEREKINFLDWRFCACVCVCACALQREDHLKDGRKERWSEKENERKNLSAVTLCR
jgi:hypothetical protein